MRRQRSKAFNVEALLESERGIPAVPTDLRSRAVRRARRAVVEGRAVSIVAVRPARLRWAIAAASVLVLGALATAAIEHRPRQVLSTIPDAAPSPPGLASPRLASPEPDLTSFEPPPRSRAGRPVRRVLTHAEAYARELRLLQPAREAVARDDFDSALAATAAHERRFPHGELVEEREALRIVALSGEQRGAVARIAAAAFHQRFPNSLLQKRVDDALRGLP
jgi:signal transduction histidine kinase